MRLTRVGNQIIHGKLQHIINTHLATHQSTLDLFNSVRLIAPLICNCQQPLAYISNYWPLFDEGLKQSEKKKATVSCTLPINCFYYWCSLQQWMPPFLEVVVETLAHKEVSYMYEFELLASKIAIVHMICITANLNNLYLKKIPHITHNDIIVYQ